MNSDIVAVIVSTVMAFVLSSTYYTVFAEALTRHSTAVAATGSQRPPLWKMLVELVRSLVLSFVLLAAADRMRLDGPGDAVMLGLGAWVGFPLVLWTGAMLWENVPWQLAALHGGDWLVKLLVVSGIVVLVG